MFKGLLVTALVLLAIGAGLIWPTLRVYNYINFDRQCEGYLKRAADSNTIELARKELDKALAYIETEKLTEGYTSILYTTPDEDVGFWYSNLTSARVELNTIDSNSTQLERSNVLMKLRETLLDNNADGDEVTTPSGISVFPHNTAYCVWGFVWFILLSVGAIVAVNEI